MISYFIRSRLSLSLYLHRSLVRSTEHVIGKALPGISLSPASCLAPLTVKTLWHWGAVAPKDYCCFTYLFFQTKRELAFLPPLFIPFLGAIVYIFRFHTFKRIGEFLERSLEKRKRKMDLLACAN